MAQEVKDPPPMLYLLIDGDGHHELTEDLMIAKVWDLITNNQEVTFQRSTHTLKGNPLTVIEVI